MSTLRRTAEWALLLLLLLLGLPGPAACSSNATARSGLDLGFIASRDTAPDGRARLRLLGPLFEYSRAPDGTRFWALRPLVSRLDAPSASRRITEYLWPLAVVKRLGTDVFWRFLLAYGNDFDCTDPASRYRTVLFPLLFRGRDKTGHGYFALFPLGGVIHEYLGLDRIRFLLFPLFVHSSVRDIHTRTVLWPLISWGGKPGVDRLRVFPFYGKSVRGTQWSKTFVLWPFWTSARYGPAGSPGRSWILFPLLGRSRLPGQSTWMFLPPFFRWSRGNGVTWHNLPWPFVQYRSGDMEKLYLWPLWGRKTLARERRWFALWPILWSIRNERRGETVDRFYALPLVYSERRSTPAGVSPPGESSRYFKLWPLISYLREGAESRWRALALWPLKRTGSIERNLAPLWTLFSRVRRGTDTELELLWGLFRYRRGETSSRLSLFPLFSFSRDARARSREWSFLLGLAGSRREGLRRSFRLLYFLKF